ncbi:MAG: TIGR03086 family metal-binding protein [Jatrophihabitans sp.]|uniref:TIGR03086 family metal-binding protein n=1 Tax=Jatrophihabitans sp. TaxID=1932789 RepID=UPI003F7D2CDA
MDERASLFVQGQQAFSLRVAEIGSAQWDAPTPCSEWTVAELVDHLIDEHRWAPSLLAGLTFTEADARVSAMPPPDADRVGAWQEAATLSHAAFFAAGALDREVDLSRGWTPARDYLAEMTFDLCVHAWDLGRAIGSPERLPDELVEAVWVDALGFGDLASSGVFDRPVPVPDDAPVLERLLALTGRDPHWRRPSA